MSHITMRWTINWYFYELPRMWLIAIVIASKQGCTRAIAEGVNDAYG